MNVRDDRQPSGDERVGYASAPASADRMPPADPPAGRVLERGRLKAYRPLGAAARAESVARGLAAYARGEFYLAHEEMEPAWMGSDDPAERALVGGLIKLAAGFVHAQRGNPAGVRTNLVGALARLATALELGGRAPGLDATLDIRSLIAAIDGILANLPGVPPGSSDRRSPAAPLPVHVVGPTSPRHREPLGIAAPALAWTD